LTTPATAPLLLQDGAALLCVLVLIWLAARFGRRYLPGGVTLRDPGALQLRASLPLDARRRLHLVETPGGAVLALTGGGQDLLLPLPTRQTAP
jgi:flagellar biogenesis protein FliO